MAKFIVIEGPNASGKSTLAEALKRDYFKNNRPAITTQEPTYGPVGIAIRRDADRMSTKALAAAFAADRLQHCVQIREWLDNGITVICDRYLPSSYVYQGIIGGVDSDYITAVNQGVLVPDATVLVSVPSIVAWQRLNARRAEDAVFNPVSMEEVSREHQAYAGLIIDTELVINVRGVDDVDGAVKTAGYIRRMLL